MGGRTQKKFGDFDEERLAVFLQETDVDGRFEVRNGLVRKVDFAHRAASTPATARRLPPPPPLASRRPTDLRQAAGGNDDEDTLVMLANRSLNVSDEAHEMVGEGPVKVDAYGSFAEEVATDTTPPPPPGVGWMKFQDDGLLWWYYEGQKGKYWCSEATGNEVQPYLF